MENYKWDLKSNYLLAFTVYKHGLNPERWNLISEYLSDFIEITPQNCKNQFEILCQQYGEDWEKEPGESLQSYIFSIIKRLYYGDLSGRMTESRDLLMVTYDFLRLFKGGRITSNDVNEILQDINNTAITDNHTNDHDQQRKLLILERFKLHMAKRISQTSDHSSFPVELLPPPPFFQPQLLLTNYTLPEQLILTTTENDRQVPSIDNHQKSNTMAISSFPIIIQSNNLLLENDKHSLNNNNNHHHQSNEIDIDEIELSSDDDQERTAIAHISTNDEPINNSNDESTFISDEQIETNESSNIPAIPIDASNSDDKDLYENLSTASISNPSTFDTRSSGEERTASSITDQPISSNHQLNASISGSSDYVTLDSDQIRPSQMQYHHSIQTESNETIPTRIPIVDDEVARMDAEQIPEPIPADITDVTVPNDNAIFIVDESISNTDISEILITNINEKSIISNGSLHENNESTMTKNSRRQSRLRTNSMSYNYRKSITSILNNLKDAKYGSDFAKSLKSFKLPEEYYFRIKKPLDIPEIRERMNNGDYDDNILLFERDILLMFTNALSIYHRDIDIHKHADYMINYAMELLTPMEEIVTPWKNDADSSSIFHPDVDGNDSDDNTLDLPSNASTTSSSIRGDLSTKNLRRPAPSYHPMPKRQRKTTH